MARGRGGRLAVARLPAYAPERNPVEYLWGHLKEHELGNLLVRQAHALSRDSKLVHPGVVPAANVVIGARQASA